MGGFKKEVDPGSYQNIYLLYMNNAIILPENPCANEIAQKLNPFDKLVSNDQLSYLPNLYLRQYKHIDELNRIRHDFPEQKLLLPRPRSSWDFVLEDAKFASTIMQERKKLKIATSNTIVKHCKNEIQKRELRSEEQYHFNRITSGMLSQALLDQFRRHNEPIVEMKKEEIKEEEPLVQKKMQDDVFLDDAEGDFGYAQAEPALFDDLLDVGANENNVVQEEPAPVVHIESISTYITEKYASRKHIINKEPFIVVSRKGSLKKINESVRKRLKFKEEEEESLGRSIASATVLLSNLQNTIEEIKAAQYVDPISTSECLFGTEKAPRKKKDEDGIDLRWSPQELEKLENRNDKNNIRKGKFDSGVLMLSFGIEEDEYKKTFEKQINGDKRFPPTLKNVEKAHPQRKQKYYNEFHDKDFEEFLMKHNKVKLFEKFSEKSSMIFPENYSHDEVEEAENISAGRLFIYKPEKLMEKVVFLKEERQVKTSLRSQPRHPIDEPRALLLAFLVEQYLREFGNNWKNISQLICRHIVFAQKHVTMEFVQQIYQMVIHLAENKKSIPGMELWDKKVLPHSCWPTQSYSTHHCDVESGKNENQMDVENENYTQEDTPMTSDYYKKLLEQEVQESKQNSYQQFEEYFQNFSKPFIGNLNKFHTGSDESVFINSIWSILEEYEEATNITHYHEKNQMSYDKENRSQILTESLKGQIKVACPFRKKKSINEKNNELVKILQALRTRANPPQNPLPKKPEGDKPLGSNASQKASTNQPNASAHAKQPEKADQAKSSMKSPEKPGGRLGAPSKKDKKQKDNDDKK